MSKKKECLGPENLHDPSTMERMFKELVELSDFDFAVRMGREAAFNVMLRMEKRNAKAYKGDKGKDWLNDPEYKNRMLWAELMVCLINRLEKAQQRGHL